MWLGWKKGGKVSHHPTIRSTFSFSSDDVISFDRSTRFHSLDLKFSFPKKRYKATTHTQCKYAENGKRNALNLYIQETFTGQPVWIAYLIVFFSVPGPAISPRIFGNLSSHSKRFDFSCNCKEKRKILLFKQRKNAKKSYQLNRCLATNFPSPNSSSRPPEL